MAQAQPKIPINRFFVFGFLAALYLWLGLSHEYWRDELHAWRLVMSSDSWSALWVNRAHDGHPMAWFAVLYGLKQVGFGVGGLKIANLAFSIGGLFLLFSQSRFNVWLKIIIALSFWHLYEYNIFARNYAIGVFFAYLFCAVYPNRNAAFNKWILLLSWMMLVQSNMSMMILGTFMGAYWVFSDRLYNSIKGRFLIGGMLVFLTYSFADLALFNYMFGEKQNSFAEPSPYKKIGYPATISILAILYIIAYWLYARFYSRYQELVLMAFSVMGIVVFFTLIYPGVPRHFGHVFISFEVFFWLYLLKKDSNIDVVKNINWVAIALFSSLAVPAILMAYKEITQTYSGIEQASAAIRRIQCDDCLLVGHPEYITEAMVDLADKDVFYSLDQAKKVNFVSWNYTFSTRTPSESELLYISSKEQKPLMIVKQLSDSTKYSPRIQKIGNFGNTLREDEALEVFYLPL